MKREKCITSTAATISKLQKSKGTPMNTRTVTDAAVLIRHDIMVDIAYGGIEKKLIAKMNRVNSFYRTGRSRRGFGLERGKAERYARFCAYLFMTEKLPPKNLSDSARATRTAYKIMDLYPEIFKDHFIDRFVNWGKNANDYVAVTLSITSTEWS